MWFKVKIKNIISTYCTLLLLLSALPFWNPSIFTKLIFLRSEVCSDWPAIQCVGIDQIPQALRPLPYCDAVSRSDDTKSIKPIINETFVAVSGDIITDYIDFYCLFKHYHVCICDRRNNKLQCHGSWICVLILCSSMWVDLLVVLVSVA